MCDINEDHESIYMYGDIEKLLAKNKMRQTSLYKARKKNEKKLGLEVQASKLYIFLQIMK